MATDVELVESTSLRQLSMYRFLPRLLKDPIPQLEEIAQEAEGSIVRLDLGLFRPYLLTHPDHVAHVLRDNRDNFVRDGMFWKPLRRLLGNGIMSKGPTWQASRRMLAPFFTPRYVQTLMDGMTDAIVTAVERLEPYARTGEPVEATMEMTWIVHRAVSRVFFGDRVTVADFDRLAPAIDLAANSATWRMLLPFVPHAVPMPGDRAFTRSVQTIEEVLLPLIDVARSRDGEKGDIVSALCRARDEDGTPLTDIQIRDDVVAMFAAGTETSAVTLAWLWVALRDRPEVAQRLYEEIDRVVGNDPLRPEHITELRYTRMVLQEVSRLYSSAWLVPRQTVADDSIGSVRIPAGATVLLSPYFTHRMRWLWDDAATFDPERFSAEREAQRHRFAYFPFGGGPHQCLGMHFFTAEAQIVVAAFLSKYRPMILNSSPVTPKPAASLRPRQPIQMVVRPVATN